MSVILFCCGQSNTERLKTILPEYITGLQNKTDITPLVILIKDLYASTEASERGSFKRVITEHISEQFSNDNKDTARSLIYVYQLIAEKDDEQLPLLYFIQGNMYAEQMDSVNLKNMISSLQACSQNNEEFSGYLEKLNDFLHEMRNYVPVTQDIEGKWISDAVENYGSGIIEFPKYEIETVNVGDKIKYYIDGGAIGHFKLDHPSSSYFTGEALLSQIEKEYSYDSLYICWSSEKLSKFDLESITMARGIAGVVGTGVATGVSGGHSDLSSQLAGNLSGMVVEMGANALIDGLFSPSKRIVLIEAWLKKANNNMFEGVFSWKETKINSQSSKFKEQKDTLTLMRWDSESNIIFMAGWRGCPYAPYKIRLTKKQGEEPKDVRVPRTAASFWASIGDKVGVGYYNDGIYYKDLEKDMNCEFGKAFLKRTKAKGRNKLDFIKQYNLEQIEKLKTWCIKNLQ